MGIQGGALLQLLVIDDDTRNADLIRAALEGEFVQVSSTGNLEEALDLIRQVRPQLVLLDLEKSRFEGLELLEKIMELDPGTNVILMAQDYTPDSALDA